MSNLTGAAAARQPDAAQRVVGTFVAVASPTMRRIVKTLLDRTGLLSPCRRLRSDWTGFAGFNDYGGRFYERIWAGHRHNRSLERFRQLASDVEQRGIADPLEVCNNRTLGDGWHRLACALHLCIQKFPWSSALGTMFPTIAPWPGSDPVTRKMTQR